MLTIACGILDLSLVSILLIEIVFCTGVGDCGLCAGICTGVCIDVCIDVGDCGLGAGI